jgi:hypothetical protein
MSPAKFYEAITANFTTSVNVKDVASIPLLNESQNSSQALIIDARSVGNIFWLMIV